MIIEELEKINNLNDLLIVVNKINEIDVLNEDASFLYNDKILLKNILYNAVASRKNRLHYNKSKDINLKRLINNKLITREELFSIFMQYPNLNRDLGCLPEIFLYNVTNKKQCTCEVFNTFAKYSMILNYDFAHNDICEFKIPCCIKNLEKELEGILNKKVKISFIGNGCNGNGFKITVYKNNKLKHDFFYKVFFPRDINDTNHSEFRHGSDLEPIYAYFAQKNGRRNQFVKFYIGRVSSPFEKDAFILTDYLEKDDNKICCNNKTFVDYILSEDKRIDNTINGKIVDFGGLIENIPELKDKKLRKLVRVILMNITKNVNEEKIKFTWKIKNQNLKVIKSYISNIDIELYNHAINIIKKNIPTIPNRLIKILKGIYRESVLQGKCFSVTKYIQTEDVITGDVKKLKSNIKFLNLKIKSFLAAKNNLFGYIIVDLFKDRQAVYILNEDNNIIKIRVEKLINNKYENLLELKGKDIEAYRNDDILKVLCP